MMQRRTLAIMGDGGFWHNGLLTGVQSALFNGDDAVLLIFKNGYTSATGTQDIISTPMQADKQAVSDKHTSLSHTNMTIEATLQGLGVQWLKTVHTYEVAKVKAVLKDAFTSDYNGLKVIIAEGECQLERQRRIKPWLQSLLKKGKRVVRVKYGVDEDVCNGDHACIRLRAAWAVACAVKTHTRPRCAPAFTAPTSFKTRACLNGCGRACKRGWCAPCKPHDTAHQFAGVRPGWRGRRRAQPMADGGGRTRWLPGAKYLHSRRGTTHRGHHLLHRGVACPLV
jgi:TPP-dependent indolepyruvate ferredoxin oxidoreductase alpha subunit